MTKLNLTIVSLIFTLVLISCNKKTYTGGTKEEISSIYSVAVLPFSYRFVDKVPEKFKFKTAAINEAQCALDYQDAISGAIIKKRNKTFVIKDNGSTAEALKSAQINVTNINEVSVERLCEILGVDAVLTGRVIKTKFMNDVASVALSVYTGQVMPNEEVELMCKLVSKKNNKILWSYSDRASLSSYSIDREFLYFGRRIARSFPLR